MTQTTASKIEQPRAGWRFRLGLTILIVGWLSPLLIPVVARTSLATEWKTIILGLLAVGIPEVFTVAAIAIMGKSGYNLISAHPLNVFLKMGTWRRFQFRNEDFCPRSRRSRDCAEAYSGMPHKRSRRLTPRLGKKTIYGWKLIKQRIFSLLKKHGPPDRVSLTRYRIGLVMFALPLVFGWLGPYGAHRIPGYETHRLVVSLIGDVMFVASLFVLGGDFWDKIRALFIHDTIVPIRTGEQN